MLLTGRGLKIHHFKFGIFSLQGTPNMSYPVQHLSSVGGWDAEAGSWFNDGCSGESNDHYPDVSLKHLPAKCSEGNQTQTKSEYFWFYFATDKREKNQHVIKYLDNFWGLPYLCRHVEHHGDDRRVFVAINDETHFLKTLTEIDRVLCQMLYTLTT